MDVVEPTLVLTAACQGEASPDAILREASSELTTTAVVYWAPLSRG